MDPDPVRHATWRLAVDPDALRRALLGHPLGEAGMALAEEISLDDAEVLRRGGIEAAPRAWSESWRAADDLARGAMDRPMDRWEEPFEPRIARDVASWVPEGGALFVGNSTPIRDLDLAMAPRGGLSVFANRGAGGIDGLTSTALGIAAVDGGATIGLLGDLSLLHDAGAVLWNGRRGVDLTLVVVNNGGGHVFSLLPQRDLPEHRELFVTPHAVDIGDLCGAAGAGHERVERASDLRPTLDRAAGAGGLNVVEVAVDAELGLRRRGELQDGVDSALAGS
jgi:2-succinyl-5-enolpyruvyl-6-hydroxy-3-cyclohexene-1-carboxylate synthase